jgi:hypothetical protein
LGGLQSRGFSFSHRECLPRKKSCLVLVVFEYIFFAYILLYFIVFCIFIQRENFLCCCFSINLLVSTQKVNSNKLSSISNEMVTIIFHHFPLCDHPQNFILLEIFMFTNDYLYLGIRPRCLKNQTRKVHFIMWVVASIYIYIFSTKRMGYYSPSLLNSFPLTNSHLLQDFGG